MDNWAGRILAGDLRAIARAATVIENRRPESVPLMRELFPHTGRAQIIGITGAPGAGKSTFVNALARVLRAAGHSIGIIAVDPTSPFSGGAILGDRIRMQAHHSDPGVFIRSMASRGALGGLAHATMDLALLLDAAGRDYVLIETVGVGQDQVDIVRLATTNVVLLVPGMGDDVQAIKAGLMEIADVFVINKADHDGAERLEREVKAAIGLASRKDGWTPPVVRAVASEGQGIEEALQAIQSFHADRNMVDLWELRLHEMYRERLAERVPRAEVRKAAESVATRARDPYSVVEEWLQEEN